MKKIILTAAAVMAFGLTNAQDVKFGAKAALNVSTISGDVEETSSLIGFQVGGFAEFKLSEKFAFQPELMYSAQGGKESYTEAYDFMTVSSEATYKLSYINLPLMLKYYATPKLSVEFGPQVGFLLSAKQDYEATFSLFGETESESGSEDIKDDMESIAFGLNFGAGFDITENITAGLRYNLGLSNIADDEDYTVKNNVLSVSVGYKF